MKTFLMMCVLCPTLALATNNPHEKPFSTAQSNAESSSKATGGNAATGPQSQQQTASADNLGNAQTVNQHYEQPRQAPAVAQGSIIPPSCGAGGNAGGSNSHGAAFLGFSWVTADCHRYIAAQNYMALGMPDFACEILNTTKTAKRVVRELGIPLPDCRFAEKNLQRKADSAPTVVVIPTTGESKDMDEKLRRAFEASQSK